MMVTPETQNACNSHKQTDKRADLEVPDHTVAKRANLSDSQPSSSSTCSPRLRRICTTHLVTLETQ